MKKYLDKKKQNGRDNSIYEPWSDFIFFLDTHRVALRIIRLRFSLFDNP